VSDARPELAPCIRFDVMSSARVSNYWLGGAEHYSADRAAAEEFIQRCPQIVDIARESRRFLVRVVRYLAGTAGVRQFLDIGAGLPFHQHTHEVAQSVAADARIVYVDNDPLVVAHAMAWMTNTTAAGAVDYLEADVRDPEAILARASRTFRADKPIAVLLLGVLGHAVSDTDEVYRILRRLMAGAPAGSFLVLSDGVDTGDLPHREACIRHGYQLRSYPEFLACFDRLELLEPGAVPLNRWRPDDPRLGLGEPLHGHAGVARKPTL
jgi:hypothetical protein